MSKRCLPVFEHASNQPIRNLSRLMSDGAIVYFSAEQRVRNSSHRQNPVSAALIPA